MFCYGIDLLSLYCCLCIITNWRWRVGDGLMLTGDYTKSIIFIKMSKKLYSPYNLKNPLKYSIFYRFIDFQPCGAIFNHKQEY